VPMTITEFGGKRWPGLEFGGVSAGVGIARFRRGAKCGRGKAGASTTSTDAAVGLRSEGATLRRSHALTLSRLAAGVLPPEPFLSGVAPSATNVICRTIA